MTSLKISCSPLLEGGKVTLRPSGCNVTLRPSGCKVWRKNDPEFFFSRIFFQIFADSKWNKITYLLFIVKSKQNRKFSGNFLTETFQDFFDNLASRKVTLPPSNKGEQEIFRDVKGCNWIQNGIKNTVSSCLYGEGPLNSRVLISSFVRVF